MSSTYEGYEGVEQLCRAAAWAGEVRGDFWYGWRAADIVALHVGWKYHYLDEYPDQASGAAVKLALKRGRALLRATGSMRDGLAQQFEREMREDARAFDLRGSAEV